MAGNGIGQVNEELAHAGLLEKCAKQHKEEDEGGTGADSRAEDPLLVIPQMLYNVLKAQVALEEAR